MGALQGYRTRGSWAEPLDPRLKLTWLLLLWTLALTAQDDVLLALLPPAICLVSLSARVTPREHAVPLLLLGAVGLQFLVLQLLFGREGEVAFHLGPLAVHQDGPGLALTATLRLATVVLASLQFSWWTSPWQLTSLLRSLFVPHRIAVLGGLALRFLPLMQSDLQAVVAAQASRGVPLEGGVARMRALLPIGSAFLYRSLRRANDTALALELRGLGGAAEPTALHEVRLTHRQAVVTGILWLTICWRLVSLLR